MTNPETRYGKALDNFAQHIDEMHDLVHDGFKAPEQIVEATKGTLIAVWELQIEYAAMMRSSERGDSN